jgi:hypothetical protein
MAAQRCFADVGLWWLGPIRQDHHTPRPDCSFDATSANDTDNPQYRTAGKAAPGLAFAGGSE